MHILVLLYYYILFWCELTRQNLCANEFSEKKTESTLSKVPFWINQNILIDIILERKNMN